MSIETLLAAYDEQARGVTPSPPPGVTNEQDGPLVRVVGQFRGFISAPCDVGVQGAELDRLIARQRDYFAARGEAVEWKTHGHDRPADLADRLRAAGFVAEEQETVLIGLAEEIAADPVLPETITLRQVTSATDIDRIIAMESDVWGDDLGWLGEELLSRIAADSDELVVLVAETGGRTDDGNGCGPEVVSAAWIAFRDGTEFAGLWGGTTVPEWRGHGVYRALVARRAQLALARGVRYLQVDATDDSNPILSRLGFRAVTTTTPYVWSPTG
jgi:GNAT superfamily N-acetyltransferase